MEKSPNDSLPVRVTLILLGTRIHKRIWIPLTKEVRVPKLSRIQVRGTFVQLASVSCDNSQTVPAIFNFYCLLIQIKFMLIKDDWLNRSHGILDLAADLTYLYIEHLFALVNHELSQNKSDCNTGRWREYLCIYHLSTSIKNWFSIYHYDIWWYMRECVEVSEGGCQYSLQTWVVISKNHEWP